MNKLHTERLILREFKESDAKAMYNNWIYDERVAKYCRQFSHKSVTQAEEYLKLCMDAEYCWATTLKENDEPMGCVDLLGVNSIGVPEIGYVLSYDYWGKGIMTEAVKVVIEEK